MRSWTAAYVVLLIGHVWAADPLPIRRTIVESDQMAAELTRADRATSLRLTRAAFEAKVERAAAGQEQCRRPPLLLRSHYRAQCDGEQISGSGQWTIQPQGTVAGCMSIEPLTLALRSAQWANGTDAVLGPLREAASGWEVLVEGGEERVLQLSWSARGHRRPEGIYYSLNIPPAGVTTWEILLPADQALITKTDQCQIIDVRIDGANNRVWTMAASGARQIEFIVAPVAAGQPTWFVGQRQKCQLDASTIDCEWQLQASAVPLRADLLEFEIDDSVVVIEITAPGLKSWEIVNPGRYRARFAEPISTMALTVRGVSGIKDAAAWTCPTLKVVNAVSLGETIILTVPSEIALEDFRTGAFRLLNSQIRDSGQQVLTLQSSWVRRADNSRPSGRLRRANGVVDVSENYLWELAPDRQFIVGRMTIRPRHEPLTLWSIALPPAWDVDNVESITKEPLRWTVRRDAAERVTLQLEFERPIPPGHVRPLTIEFRGRPLGNSEATLPFPNFELHRVRQRSMRWQVRGSPALDIKSQVGPFALAHADDSGPLPNGASNVSWTFPLGRVEGALLVQPKAARFSAAGAGRLRVQNDELLSEFRMVVRPEYGSLTAVRLIAPAAASGTGLWRAENGVHIRSCKRLDQWSRVIATISAGDSVISALASATLANQAGQVWQMAFDRPISQPITLDYSALLRAAPDPHILVAQSLAGLSGTPLTNRVFANLVPLQENSIVSPALWSVADALNQEHTWRYYDFSNRTQAPAEWRTTDGVPTLRYRDHGPDTPIDLDGRASRRLTIAKARITALLTGDERILVRYQATMRGASGTSVALDLPTDAELIDVQMDGHAVSGLRQRGQRVDLIIPDDTGTVPVEITYAVPGLSFWPVGQLQAEAPRWPGDVDATLWSWQLPPGWNALFVGRAESPGKLLTANSGFDQSGHQVFPGDGPTLWVTQPNAFRRTSWMIGAFAVVVALLWQPKRVGTLVTLAATIIVWVILPGPARGLLWGPLLVFAGMFVWNLWPQQWRWQTVSTGLTVSVLGATVAMDSPTPITVWLTRPRDNEPSLVYAPVALMKLLDQMAVSAQPTGAWIVHSAKYHSQIGRDRIDTRHTWVVESRQTGSEFVVPVAGHDLVELTLDGQPGMSTIQDGQLRIAIPDRRKVSIQARFSTPPKVHDNGFSFQCAILPTPGAHWHIDIDPGLRLNPVTAGFGAIHQEPRHCSVDLGRAVNLDCSWQFANEDTPTSFIHEIYFWDLSSPAARLYGILKRSRPTNEDAQWIVDVPPELTTMAVRTLNRKQPMTWNTINTEGGQRLQIQTSGPVENSMVVVEFGSRFPLNSALPLPMPACQHVSGTIVAWRGGNDVRPGPVRGFLTVNEDLFRRDWLEPAQLNDFAGPIRAWRKSATANEPFIRVNVGPMPIWKGESLQRWFLGPKRAELTAHATLQTDGDTLPLIEWDVPQPVTITEVTGPAVAQWYRFGNRVQVWLTHPQNQTDVAILGFVQRSEESARFDVPVVRPVNAAPTQRIAIASRPGWELTATVAQQLTPLPQATIDELWYRNERLNYRLVVQPRPAHRTGDYRLTTSAMMADGRPTALATIEARGTTSKLSGAVVSMSVNPGDEVIVQASDLKLTEVPTLPGHRRWIVHPTAAGTKKWFVHFQVVGHGAVRSWSIPVTNLEFSDQQPMQYLQELTLGNGLRAADSAGLDPLSANRWRSQQVDWRMNVDLIPSFLPQR